MITLVLLGLLAVASATPIAEPKADYSGHSVIRVVPKTKHQLDYLGRMLQEGNLDFWLEPTTLGRPVDIRVNPVERIQYGTRLTVLGFQPEVTIRDVQELIDGQKVNRNAKWADWTEYEDLASIEGWMVEIADMYDFVTLTDIGTSYEGRTVWVMNINRDSGMEKTTAFIDCNIHAREWITSAMCTWMINAFLTDDQYANVLDEWDLHIIPVLNVDGFEFSHTNDRLWRKTRTDYDSVFGCRGADPNRNWDSNFGGPGTSSDKCSDIYHGPEPFSEPITLAASNYIAENADAISVYMSVHSYSQFILLPYGYTSAPPPDYDDLMAVGLMGEEAIEAMYNTQYVTDSVPNILYEASGGSFDWTYDALGIKWSFAFELRDQGFYGFLLPADQIIPCAEETTAGVVAMLFGARDFEKRQ